MDRRSCGHSTDPSSGRQHVRLSSLVDHNSANILQFLLPVDLRHRLHTFPIGHCGAAQCCWRANDCTISSISSTGLVVTCCWHKHTGRQWGCEEQGLPRSLSSARLLCRSDMPLLHLLGLVMGLYCIPYANNYVASSTLSARSTCSSFGLLPVYLLHN